MNDRPVLAARLGAFISFVLIVLFLASCALTGPRADTIHWTPVAAPPGMDVPGGQWIKVDAPAGHKLLAAVVRPRGAGPFPVVVLLHGSGGFQPAHLELAQELAGAGFVVVAGCWQFVSAKNPVCSEAPAPAAWQADPAGNSGKELIAAARTLPGVRSDRVGLYGLSRGGNAALWAASTGAKVQAIVADAPAHNPVRVKPAPPSTATVISGLMAPTLILHGTADRVVPVEQSREYERAAHALGKPVRAVYFEGVGHQTTLPPLGGEPERLASVRRSAQPDARRQAIEFLREPLAVR